MQSDRTYQIVAVAQLHAGAIQTRRHINETKLRELADSVKAKGVLEPLLVRPSKKVGHFEIVAGERRFRAAVLAEVGSVPCLVRELTDAEALEINVIENLQREDVHPLDEALGYKRLLEMDGYDVTALAAKVGRSASYVYQRLKLTDLIEPAQEAFLADKLQAGHALMIARLTNEQQTRVLQAMRLLKGGDADDRFNYYGDDDGGWSPARVRRWIEETFHLDLHSAAFKKDDVDLVPGAGPCTTCPKRTGANPMLFDDVKKGDTCTDPECFKRKVDAHVERRRTELTAKHQDLIQVSTAYGFYGKDEQQLATAGVLPSARYVEAKKGDAGAVPAVVVHANHDHGKLGKLVYVKPKGKERSTSDHNPRTGLSKADEEKKKLEKLTSQRVLSAILAAVPTTLETLIVRDVILPRLADDATPHSKTERAYWTNALGVDPDDIDDAVLTPRQLSKAVLLTTLWPCVFGYHGDAALKKAAECYGVDIKAIAAAVKAESKPIAKPAAKKADKPAAGKKPAKKARKAR